MTGDHRPDVAFADLGSADLVVDAVYAGGTTGNLRDEPINKIVPGVGNQGGFRPAGHPKNGAVRLSVLFTTGGEVDWPDQLDAETGTFTYFGDNRTPGRDLHAPSRGGNLLLRDAFAAARGTPEERAAKVPPFLLFERARERGRAVRFRGLLVPGGPTLSADDELSAVWRTTAGERFQNYRARFTVLDESRVTRAWIRHVLSGGDRMQGAPRAWADWVTDRTYRPLVAPRTTDLRSKESQLPSDKVGAAVLSTIREHFRGRESYFESCAVEIWRLMAPATGDCDVTRPSRDGGRDAVGKYRIGPPTAQITVDFALEAKCYSPGNSVGVREMSRLVSRLRHRNFGVLVTTSHFHKQVQEEVRDDGHPIVMVCGRDIVEALRGHGISTADQAKGWLEQACPLPV
ncbi:restriction endonuclease [Kitasatospora sp. NPDC051853]|uniref:restriction endonuclease n=1 Tax=Kitasatospora sp. NPDC051853 TaxID=3364058 RepID=UPI0037AD24D3